MRDSKLSDPWGNPKFKSYNIEHVMPQQWETYWSLPGGTTKQERNGHVHSIGNLTLLNGKLNNKAKNLPFAKKKDLYNKYAKTNLLHDILRKPRGSAGTSAETY